jgi:hypothetical protein
MEKKKRYTATLRLPKGGKQAWTDIMQANVKISDNAYENQPLVMATAKFKNGIMVASGVLKSDSPAEFNIKFCYTFDAQGTLIDSPYQPIDVSDHEDFMHNGYIFNLNDDESVEYMLTIKERNL